jgi:hypothetical protein
MVDYRAGDGTEAAASRPVLTSFCADNRKIVVRRQIGYDSCRSRLPLAARAGQCPDLFLHQQIHQLQAGLANQFTHAFTQPAHRTWCGKTQRRAQARCGFWEARKA